MEFYHYVLIYLVFHFICGVLSAGISFAWFQGKWPELAERYRQEDLGNAWLGGLLFGPISLGVEIFTSGFAKYGLRWK